MTIEERVHRLTAKTLGVDIAKVTPDASLIADLGADSIDVVELVMAIEDEFAVIISDDEAYSVSRVADATALVARLSASTAA